MKLFNIILIIFLVCVCTGILIIISRLSSIKEQIMAITALLTSLVSKPNNTIKYGGLKNKLKCPIIIDGLNIVNKFINLPKNTTMGIIMDDDSGYDFCHTFGITGEYYTHNIKYLFRYIINSLLNATTGDVHFVTKTENNYRLHECMKNFLIEMASDEVKEREKSKGKTYKNPIYSNIRRNINRLKFYIAECNLSDKDKDDQRILQISSRHPKDDADLQAHSFEEQDDNCILSLAHDITNAKILSFDMFLGSQTNFIPKDYKINIINFEISEGTIKTLSDEKNIKTEETRNNVVSISRSLQTKCFIPIFTWKIINGIHQLYMEMLYKYGETLDYDYVSIIEVNDKENKEMANIFQELKSSANTFTPAPVSTPVSIKLNPSASVFNPASVPTPVTQAIQSLIVEEFKSTPDPTPVPTQVLRTFSVEADELAKSLKKNTIPKDRKTRSAWDNYFDNPENPR